MLIRIVRLHFKPGHVDEFLTIFAAHRVKIATFPGCTHMELLKDVADPNCFTTLSHWNGPDDLEKYRNSDVFNTVWTKVKPLFEKKAEAFSLVSAAS
jgi:heme oxygenase (mycobilin-producing)